MKAKVHEKGLFLYAKNYKSIFNLLKDRCEDYSYYSNDEDEIFWFHTDEIIPIAEELLNKEKPTKEERDILDFLIDNGFDFEYCCGKFEFIKDKPFENILFYK